MSTKTVSAARGSLDRRVRRFAVGAVVGWWFDVGISVPYIKRVNCVVTSYSRKRCTVTLRPRGKYRHLEEQNEYSFWIAPLWRRQGRRWARRKAPNVALIKRIINTIGDAENATVARERIGVLVKVLEIFERTKMEALKGNEKLSRP